MDDTGIKTIGKNKYQVRVKRVDARTGLECNRKATVHGTKTEARRVRDKIRDELSSTVTSRPPTPLRSYAESWMERRVGNGEIRRTTARKYGYSLRHILPVLGKLLLTAITRTDVENYIAQRKADVGIKGGNTVLNELRLLRTIARDSVAEGYAPSYWCERVKPPKVRKYSKERPNRMTPVQARRVLDALPQKWKGIVYLMVTTGLRWGEASALHWEDIDVAIGEATIKYGNDRGELVDVKTDSSYRTVPILPEVLWLFGLVRERGLVFPTMKGPRRGLLSCGFPLVKVMKAACAKAEVPYTTPHGLRRTFNNVGRTVTEREILKAISGHATDEMVEHYSHVELGEKHAAARAVADAIGIDGDDAPILPRSRRAAMREKALNVSRDVSRAAAARVAN